MQKNELRDILGCSLSTLDRRLNSTKQYEKDVFRVLLNFNKDELITRIYQGYQVNKIELNMELNKSTNIEENINNLFKNVEELHKLIQTTK